jgi:Na+/melibiose symporter-like transporter
MRPNALNLITYGVLALPVAFAGLPLFIHAPDYYATDLGVPLAAMGAALVGLRLIDAVQDPLIGSLSDRFHEMRRVIVLSGAVLLGAGFWMLFHPAGEPLLWMALSILICTTGFSMVGINLQAMGGLWQVDGSERVKVAGSREGLGLIGLLLGSVTPTVLARSMEAGAAFHWLSVLCLISLIIGVTAFWHWSGRAEMARPAKAVSLNYLTLMREPWVRRFIVTYGLSSLASAIPAVLIIFYVRDHLNAEAYTGLFLILYFVSGAATMPLWQRISARFGKGRAWGLSMVLASLTFMWAFILPPDAVIMFAAVCILSGTAFGADLALPSAIVADRLEAQGHETAASRYYALLAFLSKLALSLATGLSLPALAWFGYQPGVAHSGVYLPLFYALIPCVIKVMAALSLRLSPLYRH